MNKFQKIAIVICILPFFGVTIAQLTNEFRYSEYRYIYLIGVATVYLSWGIATIGGLINALFIHFEKKQELKIRIFWILLSLLPHILIGFSIIISLFQSTPDNSIQLPSGEYIGRQN
ncbi:hypothetical protein [Flavobacterium soli]|uniref:hypothetical protein n=1 Tax=Flavobacterium soli TaxID=344881 RepID=UPI0012F95D4E|nr:hypothetical protein [Flavobacterium soli]